MSLELEIQKLTDAVQALTGAIETLMESPVAAPVEVDLMEESRAQIVRDLEKQDKAITAKVMSAAPVIVTYTPEDQAAAKVAVEALTPVMPAAPVFEAPAPVAAPAPAANKAPFNDGKSLITYVMDVYKQLGAEKGSGIQNVLVTLGYQNINDVKPEHYDALYAGIEALK